MVACSITFYSFVSMYFGVYMLAIAG